MVEGNLANTYAFVGRLKEALSLRRKVYSGHLKLNGAEHPDTLREANNYAMDLLKSKRYAEVKTVVRKTMPAARRVLGKSHEYTLRMSTVYASALYHDPATPDDLHEAVTTLEETERTARRVFGGAHPTTTQIEIQLQGARLFLSARESS